MRSSTKPSEADAIVSAADTQSTAAGFVAAPPVTDVEATVGPATSPATHGVTPTAAASALPSTPQPSAQSTATGASFEPGARIDHFLIEGVIASGGMGTVYKALQLEPVRRPVALKTIRLDLADAATVDRFRVEQQALAVMDHPDIARVYEAQTAPGGVPYFAMEYCEGAPIDQYCDQHRLSVRERVELVVRIARAVQRAHSHGVIHRDLKPANVLVSPCEGRAALKVIDFGIAKLTDEQLAGPNEHQATRVGEMVGTPAYMSPEQAAGVGIDGRTDVFAIGAILFKLLTGSTPLGPPPAEANSLAAIIRHVMAFEAITPTKRLATLDADQLKQLAESGGQANAKQWARSVRGDLDWITLRATQAEKLQRYATAEDLADDLERFLQQQPVIARAPSLGYRLGKFYQRRRATVLATAFAASTVIITSGAVAANRWSRDAEQRATVERVVTTTEQLLDQADAARVRASQDGRNVGPEFIVAKTALARSEALLSEHPQLNQLQQRLTKIRAEVAADERAYGLIAKLNDARERATQVDSTQHGDAFGREAGVRRLLAAFDAFGLTAVAVSPENVAARILKCPQSVQGKLVESLDFLLNESPLGVGLYLHQQGGRVTIAETVVGGSAHDSGQLRPGDRLLAIDDVDLLSAFPTSQVRVEAYRRLHRPPGERVNLTVVRGVGKPFQCELTCGGAEAYWAEQVLAIIDPDPWRRDLRRGVLRADLPTLRRLSESETLNQQPPFSVIQLSGSLFLLERNNASIRLLERAQARHPGNFWANHYLGAALAAAHDPPRPDEGLKFLTAAVSLRPQSPGARLNLATALERVGDSATAKTHIAAAARLTPEYPPLQERLARLERQGEPPAKAPATSESEADNVADHGQSPAESTVAQVDHDDLELLEAEARKLARTGDRRAALTLIQDAAALHGDDPRLRRAKGVVLLELQDYTAARIVLSDAARRTPDDAAARFYYGVALQYSGDTESAIHEYEAALQLRPDYDAVREFLNPLRDIGL